MELTQAATWHRQAAALAAAADRVGVAEADLPAVRERLTAQQVKLTAATSAVGGWPLPLTPNPADVAAAMPALGDLSPVAVAAALSALAATLDAVDAALAELGQDAGQDGSSELMVGGGPDLMGQRTPPQFTPTPAPPPPAASWPPPTPRHLPSSAYRPPAPHPAPPIGVPGPYRGVGNGSEGRRGIAAWPPTSRNLTIYAIYAAVVTILQIISFAVYNERNLSLLGPCCLVVLPGFSWAAGWLTIGVAFGSGPSDREIDRTPRLGALVSLAPDLLLCTWLGVLLANA